MIRLIGTRWKHSNVLSQGVLIGRNSCRECCTSIISKNEKVKNKNFTFILNTYNFLSNSVKIPSN